MNSRICSEEIAIDPTAAQVVVIAKTKEEI